MSLIKYLERAQRMDDLIRRHATGSVEEFCEKLGISKSVLMEHLRDLKMMGAPIRFCENRRTYYYENDFTFFHKSGTAALTDDKFIIPSGGS